LRIDPQKTQGGPIIPEIQRAAGHQVVDALNAHGMTQAKPQPPGANRLWVARIAKPGDFHKRLQWDAAITCEKGLLVRSRGDDFPRRNILKDNETFWSPTDAL